MLADAALEVHRLVKFCDETDQDIIEFPYQVHHTQEVMRKLFMEGLCLQVPGLTSIMLDHMSKL